MLDFGYYNMDCMKGMAELPDKYFELAIVDPPYGIGENGKKNATRSKLATAKKYEIFEGGGLQTAGRSIFSGAFQNITKSDHFRRKSFYIKNSIRQPVLDRMGQKQRRK